MKRNNYAMYAAVLGLSACLLSACQNAEAHTERAASAAANMQETKTDDQNESRQEGNASAKSDAKAQTADGQAAAASAAKQETAPVLHLESDAASFEPRDEMVYVVGNRVNVRKTPMTKDASGEAADNIAFVASKGASFHRTGYTKNFSRVEKNGAGYYISSAYLSEKKPEEIAAEGKTAQSTAAAANAADAAHAEAKAETKTNGAGNAASNAKFEDGAKIGLNSSWDYASFSVINSGKAVFYAAKANRKGKVIAVNAGHGTEGGAAVKTYCHPDKTPKLTGGTTKAGAVKAAAVSGGMTFADGTPEKTVTLRMAQILKEKLLAAGYDVLMLRDAADVQLDNVARTVIANHTADAHIALHWDGDGLSKAKGCFYMSVPDGLKQMAPVASHWQQHEALGDALIGGLKAQGLAIWGSNPLDMDLTQTAYSTIPSVDIELGNQHSAHDDATLQKEAEGLLAGINAYFGM